MTNVMEFHPEIGDAIWTRILYHLTSTSGQSYYTLINKLLNNGSTTRILAPTISWFLMERQGAVRVESGAVDALFAVRSGPYEQGQLGLIIVQLDLQFFFFFFEWLDGFLHHRWPVLSMRYNTIVRNSSNNQMIGNREFKLMYRTSLLTDKRIDSIV